ncbi:hypothetical protein PMI29_04532 [Pseudomonas sp. GM49]|nr:hypothetical protein PMI29_04532 [Pseudomonas sp. GM49]
MDVDGLQALPLSEWLFLADSVEKVGSSGLPA